MEFDGTKKIIGHGAQAEVLLYHGFAYKVYKPSYPAEWISFETEKSIYIDRIFIDSVYHRKGYGISLIDCIEKNFPSAAEFN